jgi:hypothetical protein
MLHEEIKHLTSKKLLIQRSTEMILCKVGKFRLYKLRPSITGEPTESCHQRGCGRNGSRYRYSSYTSSGGHISSSRPYVSRTRVGKKKDNYVSVVRYVNRPLPGILFSFLNTNRGDI